MFDLKEKIIEFLKKYKSPIIWIFSSFFIIALLYRTCSSNKIHFFDFDQDVSGLLVGSFLSLFIVFLILLARFNKLDSVEILLFYIGIASVITIILFLIFDEISFEIDIINKRTHYNELESALWISLFGYSISSFIILLMRKNSFKIINILYWFIISISFMFLGVFAFKNIVVELIFFKIDLEIFNYCLGIIFFLCGLINFLLEKNDTKNLFEIILNIIVFSFSSTIFFLFTFGDTGKNINNEFIPNPAGEFHWLIFDIIFIGIFIFFQIFSYKKRSCLKIGFLTTEPRPFLRKSGAEHTEPTEKEREI